MASRQGEEEKKKPAFGPAMSKEIFQTKWHSQAKKWSGRQYTTRPTSSPAWNAAHLCTLCEEGYEYVKHFRIQTIELGLVVADFSSIARLEKGVRPQDPTQSFENPFHCALGVLMATDEFFRRFKTLKLGKDPFGLRWQDLELSVRKRLNEVMWKIEEADEEGWWLPWYMQGGS